METKLIAITGPESTGKTTLATALAAHYGSTFLADISRKYVDELTRPYTEIDVHEIARQIITEEDKAKALNQQYIFTDNCLINIKIWLEFYGWSAPEWLLAHIKNSPIQLYLLCDIDTDWVADNQRSNPHDREELLYRFMKELTHFDKDYVLVSGLDQGRLRKAVNHINTFFV